MGRSVLLLLNQMPQDPSSGAARNVRSQCEILASGGFRVRTLATTATEHGGKIDPIKVLREAGCDPVVRTLKAGKGSMGRIGTGARLLEFESRGIHHTLLDVGVGKPQAWEARLGRVFDRLVSEEVTDHPPEVLFGFGGQPGEVRRRAFVRERGAAVVMALLNLSYFTRSAFRNVDSVVTASQFMSDLYLKRIGLASAPLYSPFDVEDIIAEQRVARFLTYINPSLHKGVMFFARLAEEIGNERPDIPIMVVESRGTAGHVVAAGLRGGFDLRRHGNIMVSPGVSQPRHIYAATRVLLVPSVWEEPFGRVASEAVLNGIPPIVCERGGLAEAAGGGGFVVPLPASLTPKTLRPVEAPDVAEWKELAVRLMTDDPFYAEACGRAQGAAATAPWAPDAMRKRTLSFFSRACRAPGETAGPFVVAGTG